MPWIVGRFGTGMLFLCGGTNLDLDSRRRWFNRLGLCLFSMSWPILFAPVPWDFEAMQD
jgi:predicted acylesterase/phospholipase RssA